MKIEIIFASLALAIGSVRAHPCGPTESNNLYPYMEVTPSLNGALKTIAKSGEKTEAHFQETGGEIEIQCWSKASFVMDFHGHVVRRAMEKKAGNYRFMVIF